jgi:hypothetical protein
MRDPARVSVSVLVSVLEFVSEGGVRGRVGHAGPVVGT